MPPDKVTAPKCPVRQGHSKSVCVEMTTGPSVVGSGHCMASVSFWKRVRMGPPKSSTVSIGHKYCLCQIFHQTVQTSQRPGPCGNSRRVGLSDNVVPPERSLLVKYHNVSTILAASVLPHQPWFGAMTARHRGRIFCDTCSWSSKSLCVCLDWRRHSYIVFSSAVS